MRSFTIFSASLLLAALPHTLAAPAPSNTISSRWLKDSKMAKALVARHTITPADDDDDAEDDYIVFLADDETRDWDDVFGDIGCNKTMVHKKATMGSTRAFTMSMKKSEGVSMFSLPNVNNLEKNQKMKLSVMPRESPEKKMFMSRDVLKRPRRISKRQSGTWLEQSTAPWSLQRVTSESTVQQNGRAATDLSYKYRFEQTAGAGVDVYVLDTGINVQHEDFGGRAQMIFSVEDDDSDAEGHGTHTAGTVGSRTFGVAKNANIFGLKVFGSDGSGDLFDSIKAIQKVVDTHNLRKNSADFRGSIVSMSLGAPNPSDAMARAIVAATDQGVHFSVAAGNENQDACSTTPAGVSIGAPIMTVGATDITDTKAGFSNFGPCTNIWAPGVDITSTFNQGPQSTSVLQGTSMACPLVTGLMAVELSLNPQFATQPELLKSHILGLSLRNSVVDQFDATPDVPKLLANNGFPGNPTRR